jgi:hypothetical protein
MYVIMLKSFEPSPLDDKLLDFRLTMKGEAE